MDEQHRIVAITIVVVLIVALLIPVCLTGCKEGKSAEESKPAEDKAGFKKPGDTQGPEAPGGGKKGPKGGS